MFFAFTGLFILTFGRFGFIIKRENKRAMEAYMLNRNEIDKKYKSANISRTIRFTEELFEKLNQTAQDNEISFNLLVLQCCKYALENMEKEEK